MNYKRWHSNLSGLALALKLCEEASRVGIEISDAYIHGVEGGDHTVNVSMLHDDLDNVQHLVNTLRKKFPLKG